MREDTQEEINVILSANKANEVLKMFGYKTEKVFPTNPNDAFFFDKIFSCIEENILNNNIDTSNSDIVSVIKNIDDNCISKSFVNFPIRFNLRREPHEDTLTHEDIQHIRNYMVAVSEMILEEIKN